MLFAVFQRPEARGFFENRRKVIGIAKAEIFRNFSDGKRCGRKLFFSVFNAQEIDVLRNRLPCFFAK